MFIDQAKENQQIELLRDVPLAPFTSFKIGGPARFLTMARTLEQLKQALSFARREGIPFLIVGGGSNLLVSDRGFDGIAIRLQLKGIKVQGNRVEAQAGVDLMALVEHAAHWGLAGIERLAGIPGLFGGAVRGNAGAYGSCIGDVIERVYALRTETMELVALTRDDCRFQYRDSRFKKDHGLVVVAASLLLEPADPQEILRQAEATVRKRQARRLQCDRSAGSFFMNPVVRDPELIRRFETEQGTHCRDGRIPAGWLIDKARLRSLAVGAAMVSPRHANYLINTGNASAQEVVRLAELVKDEVRASLGVQLEEEVSCVGFTQAAPLPS
uniref:UDP-N-acetylenolpyruvoylglucosamine reductase n=1 Tax=Geobacter sp. (strain M21) TaxID=443144 RepID=C6E2J5_GEOSM